MLNHDAILKMKENQPNERNEMLRKKSLPYSLVGPFIIKVG